MRTRLNRQSTFLPRIGSAHLLAVVAIVIALAAPAGAALVNARGIANNAIFSKHIRNGQVRSADIGTRQVTWRNLGVRSVKGNNLAPGSVGSAQVADGSLTADDLAPGTLPTFSIGAGSVTATQLASGSVTAAKLAAGSVGAAAIADGAIGTADLGAGVVTAAKIATGAVGEAEIGAGAVDSIELANGAVLAQHVGANAVGGGSLGAVVGVGLAATDVTVPNDTLETLPAEESDGYEVPFDTELWDSGSMWSGLTPFTDVVVPTAGLYQVDAWVSWSAGSGYREAQVVHEGVIVAQDRSIAGTSMGNRVNQVVGTTVSAAAGDTLVLRISHQAGSDLDADRVRLTLRRVGTLPG